MLLFIVKRILRWIPTCIVILLTTFFLCNYIPDHSDESEMTSNINLQNEGGLSVKNEQSTFYISIKSYQWTKELKEIKSEYIDLSQLLYSYCGDLKLVKDFIQLLEKDVLNPSQMVLNKKKLGAYSKLLKLNDVIDFDYPSSKIEASFKLIVEHNNSWKRNMPFIYWNGFDNAFHEWTSSILQGEWGFSKMAMKPVDDVVWRGLKQTSILAVIALLLSLFFIPFSVYLYLSESKWAKFVSMLLRLVSAIPKFIWALAFLLILSSWMQWMDPLVFKLILRGQSNNYLWYFVPALCLVLPYWGFLNDQIVQQFEIEYDKDYVQTAFAKGMSEKQVMFKHVLKNSLIPFITSFTQLIPVFLGGSVLVERIFGIPGIGDLMVEALYGKDYQVVIAITFLMSVMISLTYALGDIIYRILNPKIQID